MRGDDIGDCYCNDELNQDEGTRQEGLQQQQHQSEGMYHSGLKSGSQAWMTGLRNRLIRTLNGFNIAEPIMRRSRPKSKNKLYAKIVMIIINHAK